MSARPKPSAVVLIIAALTFVVATLAVAADPLVHVVQKGETLYAIARRYDISVESLMKANAIADPSHLLVGTKLSIPGAAAPATAPAGTTAAPPGATPAAAVPARSAVDYVVAKGDTLYGIARAHGVTVDAILKASGLSTSTIKAGQKLKIPSTAKAPATTAPSVTVPKALPEAAGPAQARAWPASGQVSYLQGKLKGVSIDVEPAAPISAIRSGTVISAGPFRGFGLVAFVQSADGLVYVYGGAASLSVRVGDPVRKGSIIGKAVTEGETAAYFFIFKGADTIDPNTAPRD